MLSERLQIRLNRIGRRLLAAPRIHVFSTSQSFTGNKIAWQELLFRRYESRHSLADAGLIF